MQKSQSPFAPINIAYEYCDLVVRNPAFCLPTWWMKWRLGRFFSGFLPFSPATNFIPTYLHNHLIHFNHPPPVMVRQALSAGILAIHRPSIKGLHRITSLGPVLPPTRVEDTYPFLIWKPLEKGFVNAWLKIFSEQHNRSAHDWHFYE